MINSDSDSDGSNELNLSEHGKLKAKKAKAVDFTEMILVVETFLFQLIQDLILN